jgi:hypothetical protein
MSIELYDEYDYNKSTQFEFDGLTFICTCIACPEQYNVFKDEKQVGYVRLRWGGLRVDSPDYMGKEIYYTNYGDGYCGEFSDEDRPVQLAKIAKIINTHIEASDDSTAFNELPTQ